MTDEAQGFGDGLAALAGVEGTAGGDAADLLIGRDLVEKLGQHGCVAHALLVNAAARVSTVFSSMPMWILRQMRRPSASLQAGQLRVLWAGGVGLLMQSSYQAGVAG